MNIIHPGDHVVLMVPQGFSNTNDGEHFKKMHTDIPDALKDAPFFFKMTSLAIGAVGSSPSVLFILRKP